MLVLDWGCCPASTAPRCRMAARRNGRRIPNVFSRLSRRPGATAAAIPFEQRALAWLEQQDPPAIEADPPDQLSFRDAPVVYVPPNDRAGVWIDRFPECRRQGRSFKVAVPTQPIVRFFWPNSPKIPTSAAPWIARLIVEIAARFDATRPDEKRFFQLNFVVHLHAHGHAVEAEKGVNACTRKASVVGRDAPAVAHEPAVQPRRSARPLNAMSLTLACILSNARPVDTVSRHLHDRVQAAGMAA